MTRYPLRIWHYALGIIRFACPTVSTGKAGPALCPAPINYPAACFGRHSFAKSVIPGPFDPAGLKSAFHLISPLFYYIFYISRSGVNCYAAQPGSARPETHDINHKVETMSRRNHYSL
jgi:hypothetical protein